MHDGLAGYAPGVDADVEPENRGVFILDSFPEVLDQDIALRDFALRQLEPRGLVAFRNNQVMIRRNRVLVPDDVSQFGFSHDRTFSRYFTKEAVGLTDFIEFAIASKIGVVPVALSRITAVTERLEIAKIVAPTHTPGFDVIDFQGHFRGRYSTKFTAISRPFQNLVRQRQTPSRDRPHR